MVAWIDGAFTLIHESHLGLLFPRWTKITLDKQTNALLYTETLLIRLRAKWEADNDDIGDMRVYSHPLTHKHTWTEAVG